MLYSVIATAGVIEQPGHLPHNVCDNCIYIDMTDDIMSPHLDSISIPARMAILAVIFGAPLENHGKLIYSTCCFIGVYRQSARSAYRVTARQWKAVEWGVLHTFAETNKPMASKETCTPNSHIRWARMLMQAMRGKNVSCLPRGGKRANPPGRTKRGRSFISRIDWGCYI